MALSTGNRSTNKTSVSVPAHPDYELSSLQLQVGRDCLEGQDRIKLETYDYLPHPSSLVTGDVALTDEQIDRYNNFLADAEFEDYSEETRRSLLGKMRITNSEVEIDSKIEYLINDADNDGCSLSSAIQYAVGNVLLTKWHVLVADYKGLGDIPLESVSIADAKMMNPRASIKQYTRENVVNWNFSRINGSMQLSFIMLLERGLEFDPETLIYNDVESYLKLALDESGDYYQQKVVYKTEGMDEGEREYVKVNNQTLKWIPVEFACDEPKANYKLPKAMGFIYPICLKALARYRVSAVYKEVQNSLAPSTFTTGWKEGDMEIFSQANGGRAYIATGPKAVNNLPDGVTFSIESGSSEMDDFHKYFAMNEKQVISMGGAVKGQTVAMTATEADINSADKNAMLETLSSTTEEAFAKIISYCAMFEGLTAPDSVDDYQRTMVTVKLPRDFATPKLGVDEVQALMQLRINRSISERELMRKLESGGWLIEDIETILAELEGEPPPLSLPLDRPVDNNDESDDNQEQESAPV